MCIFGNLTTISNPRGTRTVRLLASALGTRQTESRQGREHAMTKRVIFAEAELKEDAT